MSAGYWIEGRCYASSNDAADAYFGSGIPTLVANGATTYLAWFDKVGGVWKIKRQAISSTGVITSYTDALATAPAFTSCDTAADFLDGTAVGWGVATVMVAAYCWTLVRRAAR